MIQIQFKDGSIVQYPTGQRAESRADGKVHVLELVMCGGVGVVAEVDVADVAEIQGSVPLEVRP